jgi:hypothetical protein
VFRTASSFARKLSVVVTVALLGGVLAPVATATSANANEVPADGYYVCATGQLRAEEDTSLAYTITEGVVKSGESCSGAVVIPQGVTSLEYNAFQNSSLTSITIPASPEKMLSTQSLVLQPGWLAFQIHTSRAWQKFELKK